MAIALAAAVSLASGYLLVGAGWPRSRTSLSAWAMKLSLAAGFGLAISSVAFFLARMDDTPHFVLIDFLVLTVLCVFYGLLRLRSGSMDAPKEAIADLVIAPWLERVLISCFVFTIAAGLYNAVVTVLVHPHGYGWDAFSIWNLHARFLFRGGSHWRDGFNALIPWSHPDYPILLPATTARIWSHLGNDSPTIPAVLGLVFTVSTITLLVSSLSFLRGRNAAILAGIALSATPFFIEQGTAQYADVPLSFFILASMVLLHFGFQYRAETNFQRPLVPWALAGLSSGFAAWTKNEGLLFLIAMFAAYLWVFRRAEESHGESNKQSERGWGLLGATLLGAAPMLAVIAWFKHSIATSGDLFSSPALMLSKVLTPSRYWAVLRWYAKEFFHFGDWFLVPGTVLLVLFYFLVREKGASSKNPSLRASVATLGLTLTGYFAIYLITPRDLYWHLRFSLNRLFLQVWPASLFLFFLFVARQTPSQNALNSSKKCAEL
jgi:Dolichyl-phosphate-mannose-protein mannosyltransferase